MATISNKIALIILPAIDPTGVTAPCADYLIGKEKLQQTVDKIYEIKVRNKQDFKAALHQYPGQICFIWNYTHGTPTALYFGGKPITCLNTLLESDIEEVFKGANLSSDCIIASSSCCEGGENAIAKKINQVTHRQIFACENGKVAYSYLISEKGQLQVQFFNKTHENVTVAYDKSGRALHAQDTSLLAAQQGYPTAIETLASKSKTPQALYQKAAMILQKTSLDPAHNYAEDWNLWKYCTHKPYARYPIKAEQELLKKSEQGAAWAQFELGFGYHRGEWGQPDPSKAIIEFEKAALQGHKEAQYYMGYCLHRGLGIKKDVERAGDWLEKSAAQGYTEAKTYLSSIFFELLWARLMSLFTSLFEIGG